MSTLAQQMRDMVWQRRGVAGWLAWLLLLPASALFAVGVLLRAAVYRVGLRRVHHARIGVVSVGNLSVGGTGKTPVSLWLARQLDARGRRVAILLRGYGGRADAVTVVSRGDGPVVDVTTAGDEAVMLARCFDGVVLTARRRSDGVAEAERLGCDCVVLDDGFQHWALARDADLVLTDGRRDVLLPAGPLREGQWALRRADAVLLVHKQPAHMPAPTLDLPPDGPPVFPVRFRPVALVESIAGRWHEYPVGLLSGRRIAVIAGIANPAPFYDVLRQWEVQIEEIFEFPDHHHYSREDWQRLSRDTREIDLVVTTEKDLVKLEAYPFAKGKLVALRIAPEIEGGDDLVRLVMARTHRPATHGTQEDPDGHR